MKKLLTLIILVLFGQNLYSQSDEWEIFLNCESVSSIMHDDDNIWCGTNGGVVVLNKNDYSIAHHFNVANSPFLFPWIAPMGMFSNGQKIFGSEKVYKYDGGNWSTYGNMGVSCIEDGLEDSQLIGLYDGRIFRMHSNGTLDQLSNICVSEWVDSSVVDIYEENDSSLWACSFNGLCHYENGQVISYTSDNSALTTTIVNCIEMDSTGILWVGCYGIGVNGLNTFDGASWTSLDLTSIGLLSNVVRCMEIDGQGSVWVGTEGGVAVLKDGLWTAYTKFNSGLKSNLIFSIDVDEDGTVYIGTKFDYKNYTGLNILKDGEWTALSLSNSTIGANYIEGISGVGDEVYVAAGANLSKYHSEDWERYQCPEFFGFSTFTYDVDMDSNGLPWILLDAGIAKLENGQYSFFSHLANNNPYEYFPFTMAIDGQNRIWMGTDSEGVYRFDGTDWTNFRTSNSPLIKNLIMDIEADGDTVWVGCGESGGFFKVVDENWTHYSKANTQLPDKSSNWVEEIEVDANHRKYLSPYGLCIFDDPLGDWTIYNPDNSDLPHVTVTSMAFEGDILWVGTAEGLVRIEGNVWKVYDTSNSSIAGNLVLEIYVDNQNRKWIGTSAGLSLFKESVTSVFNVQEAAYDNVYPNPNNGEFELDMEGLLGELEVAVYDGVGHLVFQTQKKVIQQKVKMDLHQLPMGHYFCKVQSGNESKVYKVFIVR